MDSSVTEHPPPRLCLRGGGASVKRKEARSRRFGVREFGGTTSGSDVAGESHQSKRVSSSPDALNDDADIDGDGHGVEDACKIPKEEEEDAPIVMTGQKTHHRFVVFVGNLPYSTTDASIQHHFASLKPRSIRHRCDKATGKSKGFAFLEFDHYDRLKTCLQNFHQSKFNDGISPARMLNVELTAGGGGSKSKDRRVRLKTKNERLRQERERRAREQAKIQGKGRGVPESVQKPARDRSDNQDVHPSRRARMKG